MTKQIHIMPSFSTASPQIYEDMRQQYVYFLTNIAIATIGHG